MSFLVVALKTLGSLFLGIVILLSFLAFLASLQVRNNFLEASFYTDALAEKDAYSRIYEEALGEAEDIDEIRELSEDLGIPDADLKEILNILVPVELVQEQSEFVIEQTIAYLDGDVEELEIFIDLSHPVGAIKPVTLDYIGKRVDSAEVVHPATVDDFNRDLEILLVSIENGQIPSRVPSLSEVPPSQRNQLLDIALAELKDSSALSPRAISNLEMNWAEIKVLLLKDDGAREGFKLAAEAVAAPILDDPVSEIRLTLDAQDRLDVVEALFEDDYANRVAFLEEADSVRDTINSIQTMGLFVSLLIMVVATVLLGVIHLPRWRLSLFWPGLALLIAGVITLLFGLLFLALSPDRTLSDCGDLPTYACDTLADVLDVMVTKVANGFIVPAIPVMVIGVVMIVLSAFLFQLRGPARRETSSVDRWC